MAQVLPSLYAITVSASKSVNNALKYWNAITSLEGVVSRGIVSEIDYIRN